MSAGALVVGDAEAFGVAGVILHRLRLDLVLSEEACPLPITRLPLLRDYVLAYWPTPIAPRFADPELRLFMNADACFGALKIFFAAHQHRSQPAGFIRPRRNNAFRAADNLNRI
jgi:hypothetical protein